MLLVPQTAACGWFECDLILFIKKCHEKHSSQSAVGSIVSREVVVVDTQLCELRDRSGSIVLRISHL